jgi:hypothetical protein
MHGLPAVAGGGECARYWRTASWGLQHMGRLRLYADAQGNTALHESGFSWMAAFSLPIWALQRRHPVLATVSLLLNLAAGVAVTQQGWSENAQLAIYALTLLAGGFLAGPLRVWLLRRRGWVLSAEERDARPRPAKVAP